MFRAKAADLPALHARQADRGAELGESLYPSADGMQRLEISEPEGNTLYAGQAAPQEDA